MISGIHHITALASDPQRNLAFYTSVLGLRLVKRTVNFDDPGTYHLYFGDRLGRPGTILTFFPWPGARRGARGVGQAVVASLSVPRGGLDFWRQHLRRQGVTTTDVEERFGNQCLTLLDPDGMKLELVEDASADARSDWRVADIPRTAAIRGIHGITLLERDAEATSSFLTSQLGFSIDETDGSTRRHLVADDGLGRRVDVVADPEGTYGQIAAGSIHHVAWRVPDDAQQQNWRQQLMADGAHVSPVMDRQYFHSIYFREPGGVLFEIATDVPGFAVDEEEESLGEALRLPPWLEGERDSIASSLPPLELDQRAVEEPA